MLEQWVLDPGESVNRCVPLYPLDDRGIDAIDSPSYLNPIILYRHITQQTVQELTDDNQVLRAPPPPQEGEASFLTPKGETLCLLRMHMHEGGQSQ